LPIAKSGVTPVDAAPASAAVGVQGLDTPLRFVTGIGPQRAKLLAKLGLDTV
jgi:predicted flap endonuclease-1-like 5' DNA nuclease